MDKIKASTFCSKECNNCYLLHEEPMDSITEAREQLNKFNLDSDIKIEHPSHYTQGSVECLDAIKSSLTPEEFRGYLKGNIIKYTWRERYKSGILDLRKAQYYLKILIGFLSSFILSTLMVFGATSVVKRPLQATIISWDYSIPNSGFRIRTSTGLMVGSTLFSSRQFRFKAPLKSTCYTVSAYNSTDEGYKSSPVCVVIRSSAREGLKKWK